MSKKLIASVVSVVGLLIVTVTSSAIVLGPARTWSYVAGLTTMAGEAADEATPMQLEIARTRSLLDAERHKVDAYEDQVMDLQARAEQADREAQHLAQRQSELRDVLARARQVLRDGPSEQAPGGDYYIISERRYRPEEVERDAAARLASLEEVTTELEFRHTLASDLREAARQGEALLAEARLRQAEVAQALEQLQIRSKTAEARVQAGELAAAVAKLPADADSGELRRAMANLESRISRQERQADRLGSSTGADALSIDYTGSRGRAASLLDRLDAELGDNAGNSDADSPEGFVKTDG